MPHVCTCGDCSPVAFEDCCQYESALQQARGGILKEASILIARFKKAQSLADVLEGEGVSWSAAEGMTDPEWDLVIRAGRLKSASLVTRMLAMELLRDRDERKRRG